MIRVLLVEPMSLLRGSLAAVLSAEADLTVIAALARIEQALSIGGTARPHVAVLDVDLFANGALPLAKQFNRALPECATLILSDVDRLIAMRGALDPYAHGFVSKDTAPGELAQYIRRVAKGERVIDPTLAAAAVWAPRSPLTGREMDVLRVAASGLPSIEIARHLHLSVGTVQNYLSTIIRKTGGRNRLEAIRIAQDAGWL